MTELKPDRFHFEGAPAPVEKWPGELKLTFLQREMVELQSEVRREQNRLRCTEASRSRFGGFSR
jgi:hypothetical protein